MASLRQKTIGLTPIEASTEISLCSVCRHAVSQSTTIYCAKQKKIVEDVKNCSDFEPEPPEYRLYKRM